MKLRLNSARWTGTCARFADLGAPARVFESIYPTKIPRFRNTSSTSSFGARPAVLRASSDTPSTAGVRTCESTACLRSRAGEDDPPKFAGHNLRAECRRAFPGEAPRILDLLPRHAGCSSKSRGLHTHPKRRSLTADSCARESPVSVDKPRLLLCRVLALDQKGHAPCCLLNLKGAKASGVVQLGLGKTG